MMARRGGGTIVRLAERRAGRTRPAGGASVELDRVSVAYDGRRAVREVTVSVGPGEWVGLIGANGAGKTTLLRAALGLQARAAGAVRLAGRPLEALSERERAAVAGYLPQERRVAWNMPALEVAALGAAGLAPREGHALARACLTELEVEALASRGVLDMSGGERARVLLARLLATQARLLVADEPAAGLDPEAQLLILERLRARAEAGSAVVVTSHDLALAARACDRLAVLQHGRLRIVAEPAAALSREILAEVFGLDGELVQSRAGPILAARRIPAPLAGGGVGRSPTNEGSPRSH
jgi:iron complex transport system ATP-binding protein